LAKKLTEVIELNKDSMFTHQMINGVYRIHTHRNNK